VNPQRIAVLVVFATLGALVLLLLFYGRPRLGKQEPLPANFNRGDPDSVLEGPRLRRAATWTLATTIFCAGFLAVYFVREPFREAEYDVKFLDASVERGHVQFAPDPDKHETGANCAQCHGPDGGGGFAATDTSWPAPPLKNIYARFTRVEVKRIISQGRPGTPMPSWAIEFGGPLNDQKIEDVLNYLDTIQVDPDEKWELPATMKDGKSVFAQKCAVCHGATATGQAMGQPLPTFFAADLTTEFTRLGRKVARLDVINDLSAKLNKPTTDLTSEEIDAAFAALSPEDIMKAGETAAKNTIMRGRPNTPMPAWQNRLRPEQIDAVVAYLRSIQRAP
jgi:mono/diheme cytochrome c family protein